MNNLLIGTGTIIAIAVIAVVLLIAIIIVCWGIGARNGFVRLRNNYKETFSSIDIILKKRYDLIPNLVETVKGYAKHESETLEKVVSARNRAVSANTTAEKIEADANVSNAIRNMNIVAERYPDLKADRGFINLSGQLQHIETELAEHRKYYNAKVKEYNIAREVFPKSIIANMMHLEEAPYFQLDSDVERQNVQVKF